MCSSYQAQSMQPSAAPSAADVVSLRTCTQWSDDTKLAVTRRLCQQVIEGSTFDGVTDEAAAEDSECACNYESFSHTNELLMQLDGTVQVLRVPQSACLLTIQESQLLFHAPWLCANADELKDELWLCVAADGGQSTGAAITLNVAGMSSTLKQMLAERVTIPHSAAFLGGHRAVCRGCWLTEQLLRQPLP